ncbi:hypothetical protein CPC08DRAFT_707474 [Agrocybe pediades]|nr:hypothetical protein CPC08DRAFT_707474 [Agrocybe pediades]
MYDNSSRIPPTENTPLLAPTPSYTVAQPIMMDGNDIGPSQMRGRCPSQRRSSSGESTSNPAHGSNGTPHTPDRPSLSPSANEHSHTSPMWPSPATHIIQNSDDDVRSPSPKRRHPAHPSSLHQQSDSKSRPSFSLALPKAISLRLENSGSVARDHLAVERTFLAYVRTSLAIVGSGVALVQLFSAAAAAAPVGTTHRIQAFIRPLGASAIVLGLIVLFIGVVRYFTVQTALVKGQFPVARLATGLISVMLTALVSVTFAMLLAGKLEPKKH